MRNEAIFVIEKNRHHETKVKKKKDVCVEHKELIPSGLTNVLSFSLGVRGDYIFKQMVTYTCVKRKRSSVRSVKL